MHMCTISDYVDHAILKIYTTTESTVLIDNIFFFGGGVES